MVAIWQHDKRVLSIFSLRILTNGYPVKNLTTSFAPATRQDVFTLPSYRVTFNTGYIRCFCATTSRDLTWPWPLTFWPCQCFIYSASHARPTCYQFWLSYDYRLLSYELQNLITFPLGYREHSRRTRRVTWPITGRGKMVHIFEIPDLNLPIRFVIVR